MNPIIRCWNAFCSAASYAWGYANSEPNSILYGALLILTARFTPIIPQAIGAILIVGGLRAFVEIVREKSRANY
jgi:hypothetical protein